MFVKFTFFQPFPGIKSTDIGNRLAAEINGLLAGIQDYLWFVGIKKCFCIFDLLD
jgi:hypothetical protein